MPNHCYEVYDESIGVVLALVAHEQYSHVGLRKEDAERLCDVLNDMYAIASHHHENRKKPKTWN